MRITKEAQIGKPTKKRVNKINIDLWGQIIRLRDKKCRYCGTTETLNAHHIFTRSRLNTRYDPENGILLCAAHHTLSSVFSAHKTPRAFFLWLEGKMGKEKLDALEKRSQMDGHGLDVWAVRLFLEQELKKTTN